jgi:hypothetical protein
MENGLKGAVGRSRARQRSSLQLFLVVPLATVARYLLKLITGSPMGFTRYENKRSLVCRVRCLLDSLRTGWIFIKSLRCEDGSDFGRDFWDIVRGLGDVDAAGIRLGLDDGAGVHGISGGGVHMAGGRRLDRCRGG